MREKPVVRLRRDVLATVYGLLLIVLLVANWVGIRERYLVSSLPSSDGVGIATGDLDVRSPGDELVWWTTSKISVIYNATATPTMETAYIISATEDNSLAGLAVADFDSERKGQEIVALTKNGTLLLIARNGGSWNRTHIADLPWPSPVWTTRALVGACFDASSPVAELAIVGEHFDWPTNNKTGRVLVVSRTSNMSWQVGVAHTAAQPLLCAAAGDLNQSHPGLELLTADEEGAVTTLAVTNGSWSSTSFFNGSGPISSIAIGNLGASILGYEVGLTLGGDGLVASNRTHWLPQRIWQSNRTQILLQTLTASDVDPIHPGDELLGLGVNNVTGDSVVLVLSNEDSFWTGRPLLAFPKGYITAVQAASFDFSHAGVEVVVASRDLLSVYVIPSSTDRTVRAISAVLLPAIVLLPGTVILFALADYVGGVAAERRRRYGLRMAAKGFAQCPVCKRFVPRAKLEAHRRAHRRGQMVLSS